MKRRHVPTRMCVGCQEMKPKREMLRVVRTPEGEVLVDPTGKKSGRGAYVCPHQDCLDRAVKTRRLQKALDRELSPEVVALLRERVAARPAGAAPGATGAAHAAGAAPEATGAAPGRGTPARAGAPHGAAVSRRTGANRRQ